MGILEKEIKKVFVTVVLVIVSVTMSGCALQIIRAGVT